jgi:hypothetical protein
MHINIRPQIRRVNIAHDSRLLSLFILHPSSFIASLRRSAGRVSRCVTVSLHEYHRPFPYVRSPVPLPLRRTLRVRP